MCLAARAGSGRCSRNICKDRAITLEPFKDTSMLYKKIYYVNFINGILINFDWKYLKKYAS